MQLIRSEMSLINKHELRYNCPPYSPSMSIAAVSTVHRTRTMCSEQDTMQGKVSSSRYVFIVLGSNRFLQLSLVIMMGRKGKRVSTNNIWVGDRR